MKLTVVCTVVVVAVLHSIAIADNSSSSAVPEIGGPKKLSCAAPEQLMDIDEPKGSIGAICGRPCPSPSTRKVILSHDGAITLHCVLPDLALGKSLPWSVPHEECVNGSHMTPNGPKCNP